MSTALWHSQRNTQIMAQGAITDERRESPAPTGFFRRLGGTSIRQEVGTA